MTRIIHCDQEDIIKILAEYFKTDMKNITIDWRKILHCDDILEEYSYGVCADIKEEN